MQVENNNPTSTFPTSTEPNPFPTSTEPNACNQFGTCTPIPDNGPYEAEGPCEPCYCQCNESGDYNEACCPDGLVFNPAISHCDWPFNNENCTTYFQA